MAAGDLSPDQQAFVSLVAQQTGLDPTVVTSWVGAESGWSVNKPAHNYLNIGPGKSYASVQQAAGATASLIGTSSDYAGIRNAVAVSPSAQIKAIGASPWGTKPDSLASVYSSISGTPVALSGAGGDAMNVNALSDLLTDPGGALVDGFGKIFGALTAQVVKGALDLVFVAGGSVLIGLGIERLSGKSPADGFNQAAGMAGAAGSAQSLVGTAAKAAPEAAVLAL